MTKLFKLCKNDDWQTWSCVYFQVYFKKSVFHVSYIYSCSVLLPFEVRLSAFLLSLLLYMYWLILLVLRLLFIDFCWILGIILVLLLHAKKMTYFGFCSAWAILLWSFLASWLEVFNNLLATCAVTVFTPQNSVLCDSYSTELGVVQLELGTSAFNVSWASE